MTITPDDVGTLCEHRDHPRRQFLIVAVDGSRVTLVDLINGHEFTIMDTSTYDSSR
jgi:hypothetical protein